MKRLLIFPLALAAVLAGGATRVIQDTCGPFVDVTPQFCPFVLELYYLGITAGTSATTYSPDDPLTRGQAAVFVAKGLDQAFALSSRRAALGQWWTTTTHYDLGLGVTAVGNSPQGIVSDGADLWIAITGDSVVSRVRASDGRLLEAWTGAIGVRGVVVAMGRVLAAGDTVLYMIDPSQAAGAAEVVTSNLGSGAAALTFDGSRIWTANTDQGVSIVTPGSSLPWQTTTVTTGFARAAAILYDGANVWVTDQSAGTLLKLETNGAILQTVAVGGTPGSMVFDGANIWVATGLGETVSVVQASTGKILASLTGNGIADPIAIAFDGRRILVGSGKVQTISLWKASDLSPLGWQYVAGSAFVWAACSDGQDFWMILTSNLVARF